MPSLPADWEGFLDQVQKNLGALLEKCDEHARLWPAGAPPAGASVLVDQAVQTAQAGLEARLRKLEDRLQALDGDLSGVEAEAQQLQQAAHGLRQQSTKPGAIR